MAEKDSCSIDLVLSEVTKCNHFTIVNKEEKQLFCWRSGVPVNQFLRLACFINQNFLRNIFLMERIVINRSAYYQMIDFMMPVWFMKLKD